MHADSGGGLTRGKSVKQWTRHLLIKLVDSRLFKTVELYIGWLVDIYLAVRWVARKAREGGAHGALAEKA
jgi:hypothetical protein